MVSKFQGNKHLDGNSTGQSHVIILFRSSPISSLMSVIISCIAGTILSNILLGLPLASAFKNESAILMISISWLLIFFCPGVGIVVHDSCDRGNIAGCCVHSCDPETSDHHALVSQGGGQDEEDCLWSVLGSWPLPGQHHCQLTVWSVQGGWDLHHPTSGQDSVLSSHWSVRLLQWAVGSWTCYQTLLDGSNLLGRHPQVAHDQRWHHHGVNDV